MTIADRLLAGDHHGCSTWEAVAERFGVNERSLRGVRRLLASLGRTVLLVPEGSANHNPDSPITPVISRWPSVEKFDTESGRALAGDVLPSIGAMGVNARPASTAAPVPRSGAADEVLFGAVPGQYIVNSAAAANAHERANCAKNSHNALCSGNTPAPVGLSVRDSRNDRARDASEPGHLKTPSDDVLVSHVDVDAHNIGRDVALSFDDSSEPCDPFRRMPKLGSINTHNGYGYENSDFSRIVTNSRPAPEAFDASTFRDESAVHPPAYEPPTQPTVRRLTQEDCPDGTLILWASDIHIPIHNEAACRLMVECAEKIGVSRVVAGGDILDFNCLSTHPKEARRVVEHATILEEVAPGRWLLDWMATKKTTLLLGNHEKRLEKFVDENPVFYGSVLQNFAKVVELPAGIEVYPEDGEVQLGSLHLFHGSAEFKKSTGGPHPAARLLTMLPDQSSICGHLHRLTTASRTTKDEHGIPRTWRGWTMGHMSLEEFHRYAGKHPNWQTGFGIIRVFWLDGKPRFSVYQVEVLFDRYGKPYFEFGGTVYR